MRRGFCIGMACLLAALGLIGTASSAAASMSIGRLAPTPSVSCTGSTTDLLEPTVTSGTGYVVPALPPASALVISSWSHNAAPAPAVGALTFKVFRKVADPATYTVVGSEGPRDLSPGTLNTFAADIPVQPGDVIGINSAIPASTACYFFDPVEASLARPGNLAVNESGDFMAFTQKIINVSAVVSPSNSFTLGKTKTNRRKGTATLTVDLPNPGDLTASGKGVKAMSATGSGPVKLTIRAKGKARKKLVSTGTAKLTVQVTYTPTGGEPKTTPVKLKLKRTI